MSLGFFSYWLANSQCPSSDFTVDSEYCKSEKLNLVNNSTGATNFEWDFCSGELFEDPEDNLHFSLSGAQNTQGLAIVKENNNYYGFVTDRNGKKVYRLEFGSSLDNIPTQTTLTISGATFNLPIPIQIVKDNDNWYGLLHNGSGNNILRLDIGSDIENNEVSMVEVVSDIGLNDDRLEVVNDNGNWVAILVENRTFKMIDFGDSITNIPDPDTDIITSASSGVVRLFDLAIYYDCGNWHGLAVGYSSKSLYHLEFGTELFSSPTITVLSSTIFEGNPLSIDFTIQNGEFVGFAQDLSGNFYRIQLGDDLDNIVLSTDSFNSSSTGIITSFSLISENGEWKGFQLKNNGSLYGISFPKNCGENLGYSFDENPDNITFSQAGTHSISLKSYNSDGAFSEDYHEVLVSENTAPTISFSDNANECFGQPNNFTPSDLTLDTYSWDFDNDGSEDTDETSPDETFDSTGEKIISLTVNDGTCSNFVKDTINIYPEPITPTFFTSGSPYCTSADIAFTNLFDESDYNGATLTYVWDYNGEGTSTERNGAYNFDTEEPKTVTLTASIPGCSTVSAEPDLDLIAGPSVDFSASNLCLEDETQFTNLTEGDLITGQTWQFGDTESSTVFSPTHVYADADDYNVTLTVTNSGGCNNVLTLPLTIDDKPIADFNMGIGCEEQEVPFEDQSTVNDANIESYAWDFAGLGNSTDQNPSFAFDTEGTYPVTLTVESTYGCVDESTQNVSVQVAPTVDFDIDLGCLDATTQFLDQSESESENPINTWYWDINGDIKPNTQNPSQVFSVPGVYSATLTVTPNNLCVSSISKEFTIHELPIADFTTDKNCDNENTIFNDASTSATTSIVDYHWQFDEEGTGSNNPETHNFEQAGNYNISLTITDEVGCESNAQQTLTINPSPIAAFEVNRDIGPAPLAIDFTNQSVDAESYLWNFNDADNSTSSEENPQFAYSELGEYEARLISSNEFGCSDTTTLPITVAEPIKDLELVQITKEESEGKTNIFLTVRNNGNVAIRNIDIRIDLDNNSSVYETYTGTLFKNESVTFPLNFTFSAENNNIGYSCVTLTDSEEEYEDINLINNEGCIDFNQKVVVENSYPNPVSSNDAQIRLNMILPSKAPVQIFLMDATGAILYQDIYSDTVSGLNSFFIDIYSYRKGMYFIKVIYDQTESTQRFVKI